MGERITLTASDGFTLNAYRAAPDGPPRGGVVVIQEVWGLNNWVRSVVDRYARHGYLAVAPAMFDRVEFGYESESYTPEQFEVIGGLLRNSTTRRRCWTSPQPLKRQRPLARWALPAIASAAR